MNGPQWRGAARLAHEATAGLVDLVEAVHAGVLRLPGLPPAAGPAERTRGITGLVYRSVRGVTRLVGGSVEGLLALLATECDPAAAGEPGSERQQALLAALNGVFGDHLDATGNTLATSMSLRVLPPAPTGALAVLVHGLCMDDRAWAGPPDAPASGLVGRLQADGFSVLALRYNSGRAVARNGAELAARLEAVAAEWPLPVQRLVLIGHSMGGLVARSALHQAGQQSLRWPARVSDLVCLGTPHQGAPLEQLGHAVTSVLAATPYAAPFTRLARLRSAGITDLRHGRVLDDPEARPPLPAGVRCHAVAGLLGPAEGRRRPPQLGDGLVPLASALGHHRDPARALDFPDAQTWVGPGIGHLALLSHPEVLQRVCSWLAASSAGFQSATAAR